MGAGFLKEQGNFRRWGFCPTLDLWGGVKASDELDHPGGNGLINKDPS
jgi:hypothetical protein